MGIQGINTGSGFDVSQMAQSIFKKLDANNDGSIDKAEFQAVVKNTPGAGKNLDDMFSKIDTNGDGKIDQTENMNGLDKLVKEMQSRSPRTGRMHGGSTGGAPKSMGSASGTQSTSSASYDKKDLNKDGIVTSQEAAEYDSKHPAEVLKSRLINSFIQMKGAKGSTGQINFLA